VRLGLAPLPGAPASASPAGSSLAPLPGASSAAALQPLPSVQAPSSSLQQLPSAPSSVNQLPTVAPVAGAPAGTPSLAPLPSVATPAAPLDSTLNLGNGIPGGVVPDPTAVGPGGAFGGEVGAVPLSATGAQAAIDPSVTVQPDVAAGAQVVNIDVSNLTLNSQLNLGNLVQATPTPAI